MAGCAKSEVSFYVNSHAGIDGWLLREIRGQNTPGLLNELHPDILKKADCSDLNGNSSYNGCMMSMADNYISRSFYLTSSDIGLLINAGSFGMAEGIPSLNPYFPGGKLLVKPAFRCCFNALMSPSFNPDASV